MRVRGRFREEDGDRNEKTRGNTCNQSGGKNGNYEREGDIISVRAMEQFQGRRREVTGERREGEAKQEG